MHGCERRRRTASDLGDRRLLSEGIRSCTRCSTYPVLQDERESEKKKRENGRTERARTKEREKEREKGVASKSKEEEGMTLKVSDAICGKRICEKCISGSERERADVARSAITQRTPVPLYLLKHSALHDVSVPPEEMYFAQPHL